MAANRLDSSPHSDLSDNFNLHGRRDESKNNHSTSNSEYGSEESNTTLMNGGSLSRREEKQVSALIEISMSTLTQWTATLCIQ